MRRVRWEKYKRCERGGLDAEDGKEAKMQKKMRFELEQNRQKKYLKTLTYCKSDTQ